MVLTRIIDLSPKYPINSLVDFTKYNIDQSPESTDSEADVENNRNLGRRLDGLWVVGLKMA